MLPLLNQMADLLYPDETDGVVDFGKGELLRMLGVAMRKSVQDKATNPEFEFISRAELGLYSLLHRLNAKVNNRAVWSRVDHAK